MNKNQFFHYSVLIVDDEEQMFNIYTHQLRTAGITNIITCSDSRAVPGLLKKKEIGIILLDLTMPYLSGEKLLSIIRKEYPDLSVIIVTGTDDVSVAVECMKEGAFDYLVKPIEKSRLVSSVKRAVEIQGLKRENRDLRERFLANKVEHPEIFSRIITEDNRMRSLFIYIESVAGTKEPILITGETGVGKELIADAVHYLSFRKGEYIKVNVAGLDDTMFTDTLFGHRKGAYSGAIESRGGLVEKAVGGTLFLDEIGDLSMISQVKLLRLLEGGEYFTLGSDLIKKSNARIIVATNSDLKALMAGNKFRKDPYYRLSAHEIKVPPLRERIGDIPLLIDFFLKQAAKDMNKKKLSVHSNVYKVLKNYSFRGNIRELRSMIYDAVSRNRENEISLNLFKTVIKGRTDKVKDITHNNSTKTPIIFTQRFPTLKEATKLAIEEAITRSSSQAAAARLLGISPAALSKRLKAYRNQYK